MLRRRRFTRRSGSSGRPSRAWSSLSSAFSLSAVTATTAVSLIELQSPTTLATLTSDPPEDLTLLRIRGSFNVTVSAAGGGWTMGLTVQDTTWTPGALFEADADKRFLWTRTFRANGGAAQEWYEPDCTEITGVAFFNAGGACLLDIAPKVKVEAGRALHLVAYEIAGASALTVVSSEMRVLYQRSGRRS